ncbi:uncharacterized protein LOC115447253 [Manduca sexta]|uniref:uncharacterized protein LOC115447253 n=1 Tax=Manduca sexta TaxID=7130 RepID=UPI001890A743|nr:uncharacterized protein LOC115447253 [Manduca sexta]
MPDAETILRDLLHKAFGGADVHVKAITSGGANYTSALYTVTVPQNGQSLKLFGKVAIIGEKMRAVMNAENLYSTEQYIYTKIQKVCFPKFYGCTAELGSETILLEDLTIRGFGAYDRLQSVDWEHAASSVTAMARFHALSFAYKNEYPEDYEEATKRLMHKYDAPEDESSLKVWEKIIGGALSVVDDEELLRDKLARLLTTENASEEFAKYKMPLSVVVLTHGDYRPSNLLFRRVGGNVETIAVDYQTVHAGCPITDLLYFIFCGTDEQFRAQHYEQLLDHYYTELTLALRRLDIDVNDVYPRETFDSEIKEMLPNTLRVCVVILPIVMVDEAAAPQVAGDADIGSFALKPNELFAQRFNGILKDFVKWGVI